MSTCSRCPAAATVTLAGEPLCLEHGQEGLRAVTVRDGEVTRLEATVPRSKRQRRPSLAGSPTRRTTRARADRAALARLKLAHLAEYNALLADEMAKDGRAPVRTRPLDVYVRHLAAQRVSALTRRVISDG